jgi:hypothetical protein
LANSELDFRTPHLQSGVYIQDFSLETSLFMFYNSAAHSLLSRCPLAALLLLKSVTRKF